MISQGNTQTQQTDRYDSCWWRPWAGIGRLPDHDLGGRSAPGWLHNGWKSHPSSCSSETPEKTGSAATITKWHGRRWHTDSWEAWGGRSVSTRTEWKRARTHWYAWELHCHIYESVRRQMAFQWTPDKNKHGLACSVHWFGNYQLNNPLSLTWPQHVVCVCFFK